MRLHVVATIFFSCFLLYGCVSYNTAAPVRDINLRHVGKTKYHFVQPGESLYAVAWRYEKDYRSLAQLNNLQYPYAIHPGQLIQLNGAPIKKQAQQKKVSHSSIAKEPTAIVKHWKWPTKSHSIVRRFSGANKGIDIGGKDNDLIFATAKGKVVYAGSGIRGYGNLLIIKHNSLYLTAYAYNKRLFVKDGQWVDSGQKIAVMGKNTSLGRNSLHFEIRRAGKAVNPLGYLI